MKFKVGDRVKVVRGSYLYTAIGSEGVVISHNRDTTRVRFDKLTGEYPGIEFVVNTNGIDCYEFGVNTNYLEKIPNEIFVLNKSKFKKVSKSKKSNYRRIIL